MRTRPPSFPLPAFGTLIAWLRAHGVSGGHLAAVFGTSPANIAVLAWRARHVQRHAVLGLSLHGPDLLAARSLTAHERAVLEQATTAQRRSVAQVEKALHTIVTTSADLVAMEGRLRALSPWLGKPERPPLLRVAARVHHQWAWAALHQGHTRTALTEARRAVAFARRWYRETGSPDALQQIGATALVVSQAYLLQQHPEAAWQWLGHHVAALDAYGRTLGSEYYRQRSVSEWLLGAPAQATVSLRLAENALERAGEYDHPLRPLITSVRHRLVISPGDLDSGWALAHDVATAFGATSLEAMMVGHWSAAAALQTDSGLEHHRALEHLHLDRALARGFDHQATIAWLLSLTPVLPLSPVQRRDYIRRVLYTNAARHR